MFGGATLPIQVAQEASTDAWKWTDAVQAGSAAIIALFTAGLLYVGGSNPEFSKSSTIYQNVRPLSRNGSRLQLFP
jgi:hypothetical protein